MLLSSKKTKKGKSRGTSNMPSHSECLVIKASVDSGHTLIIAYILNFNNSTLGEAYRTIYKSRTTYALPRRGIKSKYTAGV